jgi:hypothetical protein
MQPAPEAISRGPPKPKRGGSSCASKRKKATAATVWKSCAACPAPSSAADHNEKHRQGNGADRETRAAILRRVRAVVQSFVAGNVRRLHRSLKQHYALDRTSRIRAPVSAGCIAPFVRELSWPRPWPNSTKPFARSSKPPSPNFPGSDLRQAAMRKQRGDVNI